MPDLFMDTAGWGHLVDPNQTYHSLLAADAAFSGADEAHR